MGRQWEADIEITEKLAARVVCEQFPQFGAVEVRLFGEGWDNVAFLVDGRYFFRFPRRKIAVPLIEKELRFLGVIRKALPIPIPDPMFRGLPTPAYPYPFAGYEMLPGVPACHLTWTESQRAALAEPLARFLAALHAVSAPTADLPQNPDLPGDSFGRSDIAFRIPLLVEQIIRMRPCFLKHGYDPDRPLEVLNKLREFKPAGRTCWVHGDFYPCHFLVGDQRELTGAIDWGDLHLGDPALDLSIAFTFLPETARDIFWTTYARAAGHQNVEEDVRARAEFFGFRCAIIALDYGDDVSDEAALRMARFVLSTRTASRGLS